MKILCCGCNGVKVDARLTNGEEIYPHREDLYEIPFWKCDTCGNFVGCHHKTANRTAPLGCIVTKEIKAKRIGIHAVLDPLWKSGEFKRKDIYYFGLNKEEREFLKDEVDFLETTLRKWIPDLVTFSNFCNGKNGKRIRCQTQRSSSFQGVSYFDLPNNEPEIVMYKIVDENNNVVDDLEDLTLEEAEENLTKLLNEGADVYIQMVE